MINTIVLMGRLTHDPEIKATTNGTNVCSFSVAIDRSYADGAGNRATDFINCVAWRGTADFLAKYFRKGSMVAITGSLQSRSYTDKTQNKRTAFEVVVDAVSFTGEKVGQSGNAPQGAAAKAETATTAATQQSMYAGNTVRDRLGGDDFAIIPDSEDLPF